MFCKRKLSELTKEELIEIADEKFLPLRSGEIGADSLVIPLKNDTIEIMSIWNEALRLYIKEHFNESD